MKYTLIAEDTYDGSKTTRAFEVDYLPDVLTEVELFLKGAGFVFNGNLDFVNDFEEPEWEPEVEWDIPHNEEMYDTMDLPSNNWPFTGTMPSTEESLKPASGYSHYYFDTERNT